MSIVVVIEQPNRFETTTILLNMKNLVLNVLKVFANRSSKKYKLLTSMVIKERILYRSQIFLTGSSILGEGDELADGLGAPENTDFVNS